MRNNIRKTVLCCLTILLITACVDEKVPPRSKAFIDKYFPQSTVVLVEMDDDDDDGKEYSVLLNDGTKVEFVRRQGSPLRLFPSPSSSM